MSEKKVFYSRREFLFEDDSDNRDTFINAKVELDGDYLDSSIKFGFANEGSGIGCYIWKGKQERLINCAELTAELTAEEFLTFLDELEETARRVKEAFIFAKKELEINGGGQ